MSSKAIESVAKYRVDNPERFLHLLVPTEERVRIRKMRYRRFVFSGVPGRHVDVIVAEAILRHHRLPSQDALVVEMSAVGES